MNGSKLQEAVSAWHTNRFPEAEVYHVMIKAIEELGEVASALNGDLAKNDGRSRDGSVPNEVGDVVICLMVLLGRWYPGHDVLDEVTKKLAILTDPNSGHRSAALPVNYDPDSMASGTSKVYEYIRQNNGL